MLGLDHEVVDADGATFDIRPCEGMEAWAAFEMLARANGAESTQRREPSGGHRRRADTPRVAYARMGFRPLAVRREYLRQVGL
jgi:hypothetical protein